MARRHRVPRVVLDGITQHHGTRPVARLREQVDALSLDVDASDPAFVYPGPKPRSREAALLMLADIVEAASRSPLFGNATELAEVESLVREIATELVAEGQFEECSLSLSDLGKITASLARNLNSGLAARAAGGASAGSRFSGIAPSQLN